MTRTKIILIFIAIFLLALGVVFAFSMLHKAQSPVGPSNNTTFPIASSTGSTAQNSSGSQINIPARNGSTYQALDFIHNGKTIPDVENAGNYQLAGSLPDCLPDTKCTAAPSDEFNIGYNSTAHSFVIALLREPIGKARSDTEQFLMSETGLTQNQMCALSYYVGVSQDVNETYDSGNLGFSFCPGAVKLP
jgi:hypothetical protein